MLATLRSLFLPPGPAVWPSEEKLRGHIAFRVSLAAGCVLVDLLILLLLVRHREFVRPGAARTFLCTNVIPLSLDCFLSWLLLRRRRRAFGWIVGFLTVLEGVTGLAFIQMTGSSTSYFLAVMIFAVAFLRVAYNYWIGLTMALTMQLGLALVFLLETRGVLPVASMFSSGPMALHPPVGYRLIVLVSCSVGVWMFFFAGNLLASRWSLSQAELARARSELRRAVDEARLGRLSGTVLGSYAVDELLGRGGMGEVYAARGRKKAGEVAIKLLHVHLGGDREMRARFRREAEVVQKMPPGTVADVHELGTSADGYDYIVMERLRGEDLGAHLRRREHLEVDEVVALVERAAVALDAAHALGVVHRDLKPQNVFLCSTARPDGRPDVRLLDFGVARLIDATAAGGMTATAAVIGTPGYMAPEQALGGEVGPPADVFALGAIAYRALTGKAPFPSRGAEAAVHELLHHHPGPASASRPGVHPDVDLVLALALAKDVRERYPSAGDFARDLRLAAGGRLPERVRARATRLVAEAPATLDTLTSR